MTIWEALGKCQLRNEVRKKEGKLDFRVLLRMERIKVWDRGSCCALGVCYLRKDLLRNMIFQTKLLENKSSSFTQLVAEYNLRANSSFFCYCNLLRNQIL
ncbi:hypothetical protein Patl1_03985 [Pistacia atlantica]|uniref:Uncharacterized protein n=1 Tax=Pistacia atlantica TaxID=434234 RepID=A0ACC1BU14_9ROSI|nr:hypothetical protein Patl1_03985 [Pistacia atlantica]